MMPELPDAAPLARVPSAAPDVPTASEAIPAPAGAPLVATVDAKRVACAILEVLAGVRSITDAALALGVAPARYYVLEARALAGLIAACEPRSPGPHTGSGVAAEVARLRAERDRLRDEAARYQALARIAQTAFAPLGAAGAAVVPAATTTRPPRPARAGAPAPATPPRKKRTATVRALRLVRQVQELPVGSAVPVARTGCQQPGDRAP